MGNQNSSFDEGDERHIHNSTNAHKTSSGVGNGGGGSGDNEIFHDYGIDQQRNQNTFLMNQSLNDRQQNILNHQGPNAFSVVESQQYQQHHMQQNPPGHQRGTKIKALLKGKGNNQLLKSSSSSSIQSNSKKGGGSGHNAHPSHKQIMQRANEQRLKIKQSFQRHQIQRQQQQQSHNYNHQQQQQFMNEATEKMGALFVSNSSKQQQWHQQQQYQQQQQSFPEQSNSSLNSQQRYQTQPQHQIQQMQYQQVPYPPNQLQQQQDHAKILNKHNKKKSKEQKDWEDAWEEDDESDDENDDIGSTAGSIGPAVSGRSPEIASPSPTLSPSSHQILRPTMDGAHSSAVSSVHNEESTDSSSVHRIGERIQHPQQDLTRQLDLKWDMTSHEKPSIDMFLPILRVLGKGSFGKVVLVQKRYGYEKGGLFAMKILRKTHLFKRGQIERTRTERKVLSEVRHPFIMKLHFAFQNDEKLFLVLDYCAGGELFFHLSRHRRFPEDYARFYTAELLLAFGHLHAHGIIYRDLKPENVLLDSDGHVKLGDFGLAKTGIKHPCQGASSLCGTPEYMAPEILQQKGHGFCVDYWGLGMLTYEMMTGLPPWYTTEGLDLLYHRLKHAPLEIPPFFSRAASSITYNLLQKEPKLRLGVNGMRSVMHHDFFRGLNFNLLISRQIGPPIRPCEGWSASNTTNSQQNNTKNQTQVMQNINEQQRYDLDEATSNFDGQFTRMAVNSLPSEEEQGYSSDEREGEELNENTFIGFTYDGDNNKQKN